jgi:hypothetical protein
MRAEMALVEAYAGLLTVVELVIPVSIEPSVNWMRDRGMIVLLSGSSNT